MSASQKNCPVIGLATVMLLLLNGAMVEKAFVDHAGYLVAMFFTLPALVVMARLLYASKNNH